MIDRYDAVLSALNAGVVIHAGDSAIVEANDRARSLLGIQRLEGRLATDPTWVFLEADHSLMSLDRYPVMQVIASGEPVQDMIMIVRPPSGTAVWLETNALPVVDESGRVAQVVVTFIDITARVAAEKELVRLAARDPLTGLANRAALLQEIGLRLAGPAHRPATVAFLDLDRFRVVNDSLGHRSGDELLAQVAQRLTERLCLGEILGRIGGDEFVVILGEESPTASVKRLLTAFDEPFRVGNAVTAISASIGVAEASARTGIDHAEDLLDRADTAMFAAKRDAVARWRSFDTTLHDEAVRHVEVAEELRLALRAGQIRPHFQPVYSLTDGSLIGLEALARWHRPDGSVWPPAKFLDVCAGSGQMVELGRRVLDQSCEQVAAWGLPAGRWLAVNISAHQLVSHDFPDQVAGALARHRVSPDSLQLEITEAHFVDDELAPAVLSKLRDLGVGLAVDDFGTGWSSLSRLVAMPISTLKIDRQFVATAHIDSASLAIVTSVAALAKSLGMSSVAEGIETTAQLSLIKSLGVDAVQGYLHGRPGPLEDVRPHAPEIMAA